MKQRESDLREAIERFGVRHPKKHGDWIIFMFHQEGTFFEMDSWNGALKYKVGSAIYDYWGGFEGETVFSFGGNDAWHSDKTPLPDNVIEFYCHKVAHELTRREFEYTKGPPEYRIPVEIVDRLVASLEGGIA